MSPPSAFNLEVQACAHGANVARHLCGPAVRRPRVRRPDPGAAVAETIRAVIWLCDLRGFTAVGGLPRDELIGRSTDISARWRRRRREGGKSSNSSATHARDLPTGAVTGHLRCACAPQPRTGRVAEENRRREVRTCRLSTTARAACRRRHLRQYRQRDPARLHVIGPAVNLTARIELMCRQLDRQLLAVGRLCRGGWGLPGNRSGCLP